MREFVALKLNTHWNELLTENRTFSHHLILCTPCFLYKEVLIFTKLILVKIPIQDRINNSHNGGGNAFQQLDLFIYLFLVFTNMPCKFSVPDTMWNYNKAICILDHNSGAYGSLFLSIILKKYNFLSHNNSDFFFTQGSFNPCCAAFCLSKKLKQLFNFQLLTF